MLERVSHPIDVFTVAKRFRSFISVFNTRVLKISAAAAGLLTIVGCRDRHQVSLRSGRAIERKRGRTQYLYGVLLPAAQSLRIVFGPSRVLAFYDFSRNAVLFEAQTYT